MSKRYNMDCAIRLEWRKCLEIMWLILYELADYNKKNLLDFKTHFWEYLSASQSKKGDLDEMLEQFEAETGLHFEEVKLHSDFIGNAQKTVDAICFRIGCCILWGVGDWQKKDVRDFAYKCWDYLNDYPETHKRIMKMKKDLKVKLGEMHG